MERVDWEDATLRDLKSWAVQVSYFECELVKGEDAESEIEVLDDWALAHDVVIIFASVLK